MNEWIEHDRAGLFELWRLSPRYACGAVFVDDGRIVGGAPIFRKLQGKRIESLPRSYNATPVSRGDTGKERKR